MKVIEDIFFSLLELLGFETAKFALGDLFPGALIGFFLAAALGGVVSDWKNSHKLKIIAKLPWDWFASIFAFLLSIYVWIRVDL